MDSPKRLILGYLPNNRCNLKCPYCYISQLDEWQVDDGTFKYSAAHMSSCLSQERLGGVCLINLTAQGETLLYKEIVDLVAGILGQGHYIELVTNGTVGKKVDEILALPAHLVERLEFKISFHYDELKRRDLLGAFTKNVQRIMASPASFTLELMPYDGNEPLIDEIMDYSVQHFGAPCHVTVGRDDAKKNRGLLSSDTREEYVDRWSVFDSSMFDLKMELLEVKRKEFCYAGDWTLWVDFSTGEARQCYGQPSNQNIFENPSAPIKFIPVGCHCVQPFCINGHAFLSLGAIPELDTPTYFDTRNRTTGDGDQWLKEPCASFFGQKLSVANEEYSDQEKRLSSLKFPFTFLAWSLRSFGETRDKISRRLKKG